MIHSSTRPKSGISLLFRSRHTALAQFRRCRRPKTGGSLLKRNGGGLVEDNHSACVGAATVKREPRPRLHSRGEKAPGVVLNIPLSLDGSQGGSSHANPFPGWAAAYLPVAWRRKEVCPPWLPRWRAAVNVAHQGSGARPGVGYVSRILADFGRRWNRNETHAARE